VFLSIGFSVPIVHKAPSSGILGPGGKFRAYKFLLVSLFLG